VNNLQILLNWIEQNSSVVGVMSTIAYTIITLALVLQNKTALKQTREQFSAIYQGKIYPSLVILGKRRLCLQLENQSPTPVESCSISVNETWYEQYLKFSPKMGTSRKEFWKTLPSNKLTLMPMQKTAYPICFIDNSIFDTLSDKQFEVTIRYNDKKRKPETTVFNLKSVKGSLAITDNDSYMMEKITDQLDRGNHYQRLSRIVPKYASILGSTENVNIKGAEHEQIPGT